MNEDRQPATSPHPSTDAVSPPLPLENNPPPANDAPLNGFALSSLPGDKSSAELTPFMRQWTAAKRENPDALLFFRMGDFYELFYDDAAVASRELQLTLTARDKERSMPMCGVPYHAVEQYLTRLLRKGYRIAICEQMEDPKLTKKLVRREVTRVLTPGTALDAGIGQEQNNFLAALYEVRVAEKHPSGAKAPSPSAGSILRAKARTFQARTLQRCNDCARWRCSMCRRASSGRRSFAAKMRGQQAVEEVLMAAPSEVLLAASAELPPQLERIRGADARRRLDLDAGVCRAAGRAATECAVA